MKRPSASGFTLIELIGVLAIIAIMAAILAPNALRSLDRAAVRAEDESIRRLGEQLQLHTREQIRRFPNTPTAWLPTTGPRPQDGTWIASIGTYADMPLAEIEWNKRSARRMLILDPTPNTPFASRRAILLSSMRSGCALPATVATATASFQTIWDNRDEEVPFLLNWNGWRRVLDANGNVRSTDGEYLVVERINFTPLYLAESNTYAVTLNNASRASAASGGGGGGTSGGSSGNNAGANGNGNGNANGNGNGNANGNGNGNGGNSGNNSNNGGGSGGSAGVDASYLIYFADGTRTGQLTLRAVDPPVVRDLRTGDRIDLFDAGGALNYSYVVSSENRTLEFDGVQWRAR